jgi:hypothetical protein
VWRVQRRASWPVRICYRRAPTAFAQIQPPIGGYKQLDVMNFLMNIKYVKATLYAFLTTGADIPNYPT